jgi:hypothetical protein
MCANHSRRQTMAPSTIVATGPPRNACPSKGELRLLENDRFTSYVHCRSVLRSVLKIVTSAGAPTVRVPRSRRSTRAAGGEQRD